MYANTNSALLLHIHLFLSVRITAIRQMRQLQKLISKHSSAKWAAGAPIYLSTLAQLNLCSYTSPQVAVTASSCQFFVNYFLNFFLFDLHISTCSAGKNHISDNVHSLPSSVHKRIGRGVARMKCVVAGQPSCLALILTPLIVGWQTHICTSKHC